MISALGGIVPRFPRGRPGLPRLVHKPRDRVPPREAAPVGDELARPQIAPPVSAGIDEHLILAIGHLEAPDKEVGQDGAVASVELRYPRVALAAHDQHHPRRRHAFSRQSEAEDGSLRHGGHGRRCPDVETGAEAGRLELELRDHRQPWYNDPPWGDAQECPFRGGAVSGPAVHPRPRRSSLHTYG